MYTISLEASLTKTSDISSSNSISSAIVLAQALLRVNEELHAQAPAEGTELEAWLEKQQATTAQKRDTETLESEVVLVESEEEELLEIEEIESDDEDVSISYSIEEEELIATLYGKQQGLDYVKAWYGDIGSSSRGFEFNDDAYWSQEVKSDTELEMIKDEDAQEVFTEIQYAAAGNQLSVNFDTMRKFDMWIKFNPALFGVFESMYAVTREVNYAPPK